MRDGRATMNTCACMSRTASGNEVGYPCLATLCSSPCRSTVAPNDVSPASSCCGSASASSLASHFKEGIGSGADWDLEFSDAFAEDMPFFHPDIVADLSRPSDGTVAFFDIGMSNFWHMLNYMRQTTVVLKNVPCNYRRGDVLDLLDRLGFVGGYRCVYLQVDTTRNGKAKSNFGYAFVDFVDGCLAREFFGRAARFTDWKFRSTKVAKVEWSRLQGIDNLRAHFTSQGMMQGSFPDEWRPCFLDGALRVAPS